MATNSNLPSASFDKIEFPVVRRTMRGAFRKHVHEFPKRAGGLAEKLGRGLYEFTFQIPFHDTVESMPDLYPDRLNALRDRYERGDTAPLLIPEVGTVRCYITEFEQVREGAIVSGEDATIAFIEDDVEAFQDVTAQSSKTEFASASDVYLVAITQDPPPPPVAMSVADRNKVSLFEALNEVIGAVNAIKDQAELFGNNLAAKLDRITSLCKAIHNTITFLRHPRFHRVNRALVRLWNAATVLKRDLFQKSAPVTTYTTPAPMSTGAISKRLYGTSSRGGEILKLNVVPNPFLVPANTRLHVYAS